VSRYQQATASNRGRGWGAHSSDRLLLLCAVCWPSDRARDDVAALSWRMALRSFGKQGLVETMLEAQSRQKATRDDAIRNPGTCAAWLTRPYKKAVQAHTRCCGALWLDAAPVRQSLNHARHLHIIAPVKSPSERLQHHGRGLRANNPGSTPPSPWRPRQSHMAREMSGKHHGGPTSATRVRPIEPTKHRGMAKRKRSIY
jgi:hypothetical protein